MNLLKLLGWEVERLTKPYLILITLLVVTQFAWLGVFLWSEKNMYEEMRRAGTPDYTLTFGNYLGGTPFILSIGVAGLRCEASDDDVDDPWLVLRPVDCAQTPVHSVFELVGLANDSDEWLLRTGHRLRWGAFGHVPGVTVQLLYPSSINCPRRLIHLRICVD